MSLALVTGATGLVGSHIVEQLLSDGWSVRALARSLEPARSALPAAVDIHQGDVLDERSFERAAAGCHAVFHSAANILARGGWESYRATNVEGTRNAIAAAARAGARLVHVSSVAVYGSAARYAMAKDGRRTDESSPLPPLREHTYYARSKRESEELVRRAHLEGRVWAVAVRPDVVYGPRDRQFVPRMARLIRWFAVPLLRGGRSTMPIVHAANVAQGAVLAATSDAAGGNVYNLTNDYDVTVRRFFELAGEGVGRRPDAHSDANVGGAGRAERGQAARTIGERRTIRDGEQLGARFHQSGQPVLIGPREGRTGMVSTDASGDRHSARVPVVARTQKGATVVAPSLRSVWLDPFTATSSSPSSWPPSCCPPSARCQRVGCCL
jgi:nucleoside-diphosphate-sugar epimerase